MKEQTYQRVALRFNKRKNAWQIFWISRVGYKDLNLCHSKSLPFGWIAGKPKCGYSHLRVGQFVPAPDKFFDLSGGVIK